MVHYLFNSSGEWLCFREGKYLYHPNGDCIGWTPWDDEDVVTLEGDYLGTIQGDRIYRFNDRPYRGYPGNPGFSGYPGYPGYPGFAGRSPLPSNAEDIEINTK